MKNKLDFPMQKYNPWSEDDLLGHLREDLLLCTFKHPVQRSSQLSFQSGLNSLMSLLISLWKSFQTIQSHYKIILYVNFHQVLRFLRQLTRY